MSCCHVPYSADKGSAVATERKLVKKTATVSNSSRMKMEDLKAET